jgi:hypothetical protein
MRCRSIGSGTPKFRTQSVMRNFAVDPRLFPLLRWAARESISLHNVERLMRIRAEEVDAANPQDKSA